MTPSSPIFDDDKQALRTPDGWVPITPHRWRVLGVLRRHPDRFVHTDVIHNALYGHRPDGGPMTNIIKVYVHYLRRVLEGTGYRIECKYSTGYRLVSAP